MNVETAIHLVDSMIYKPGWYFEAEDATDRFEDAIRITVHANSFRTERYLVDRDGHYTEPIDARSAFTIFCGDCNRPEDFLRRMFEEAIMPTELHEAREFFRNRHTHWAPFHPHRIDGMKRWGSPDSDKTYGL
jgi:hypothetical protein